MDGKRCPLKANESREREERRRQNLKEAHEFMRLGLKDKAVQKYQMCIKIRDDFTIAVMKLVQREFIYDKRVELVWSPYEADAQLAKLCIDQQANAVITEDSDVLVYSAAAKFSFPVLFKLDRGTGTCDIISMDWLLTPGHQPTTQKKKPGILEALLYNLASREARRPGFGVRLFCQACVLAGCDYAPNSIPGVGLVNAFKLVRDNSFRNDSVRFQKILAFLPRKIKKDLDIKAYESTLAKSEAVFYYHVVKHQDGSINPISVPRISQDENGDKHHHTNHSPFLSRFGNDWSFLGDSETTNPNYSVDAPKFASSIPTSTNNMQAKRARGSIATFAKLQENPYKKKQTRTTGSTLKPISKLKNENTKNPFSQFMSKHPQKKNDLLSFRKPKVEIKNQGKSNNLRETTQKFRNNFDYGSVEDLAEAQPSDKYEHIDSEIRNNECLHKTDENFDNNQGDSCADREILNLTDSNSCNSAYYPENIDRLSDLSMPDFENSEMDQARYQEVTSSKSNDARRTSVLDKKEHLEKGSTKKTKSTASSKYFKKEPRRVTLDPSDPPPKQIFSNSETFSSSDQVKTSRPPKNGGSFFKKSTPAAWKPSPTWTQDEIVDSPLDFNTSNLSSTRAANDFTVSKPQKSQKKRGSVGLLEAGFKKQLSNHHFSQGSKKQNSFVPHKKSGMTKRKEKKRNLDSFFEPKKKKRPIFNQLAVGTNQIHEDFLLPNL